MLEALCKPPFEPIEQVSERLLTLKTVLLLAISSLKRVGDLQALSVASIDFTPVWRKSFCTLVWGTSLRSPPRYRGPLYSRPFVLLPSGSPTRKSLTVCVQCEHWTHTSTELPSGTPLAFGGQGSFNQRYGGLQGLFRRCPYSGHL